MKWLAVAGLFLATMPVQSLWAQTKDTGQLIHLEAGDFSWQEFRVRQIPSQVDCRYEVVQGAGTVHVELLTKSEFRAFDRGHEYETMALTPDGRSGEFRRIIERQGQYACVVKNSSRARPVTVTLDVRTNINPGGDIARTLSPQRRLTVITISFAFFFVTAAWAGRRLLRAARL